MWRNRATQDVEDATEPDLEAEAAAIERLRRVVGRAEAISDAVDDLSFESGHDPDALNAARAALMSARDRLGEELG